MSFWDQLVQVGSTYAKHVGIIKQLVDAAPDQRIAVMSNYVRGLSDQSFAGFKILMANAMSEQTGAHARSILEALARNLDAVRAGQQVPAATETPSAATAVPAENTGATPSMSEEQAFIADAHFCNEHWWNQPDAEKKRTSLVDTLIKFDAARYQQFHGHLLRLRDNHMTHVKAHEQNELNSWGTYFEDRMAYFNARERTGQRDPEWMKQMRELQAVLADMDWLIKACEQFWPLIEKQRQAAAQQPADSAQPAASGN
jgi:hypothetical protein